MKDFNLKEALAGKPVTTRDGRKVTQFHVFESTNTRDIKYPVYAVVEAEGDRDESVECFTTDGRYSSINTEWDLFMDNVQKRFFNLLRDSNGKVYAANTLHKTVESAIKFAEETGVGIVKAAVPIEYEE